MVRLLKFPVLSPSASMPTSDFVDNDLNRFRAFLEEFRTESDRGCAVLVMCVIEESLKALIGRVVVNQAEDWSHFAPRGRFAVTVESAYQLGVLSKKERSTLRHLINIRNAFAHRPMAALSFDSAPIVGDCRALQMPVSYDGTDVAKLTNRQKFLMAASMLQIAISVRTDHAVRLKPANDV